MGGPVTNTATGVTNGLFTITLDFGAGVFTGAPRWLQIGVRTNGSASDFTLLSPRQPVTPTPYAITASNLTGAISASQLSGTISSNNIGAGSITTVMLASGAVGSNQLAAGAVTTTALADNAVTAAKVETISNWFAFTIANPTPASVDTFGYAVASLGSDGVLIGAHQDDTGAQNAGAAYLFSIDGTLLTTFTNPAPASDDFFGSSVAAVGSNRVLIGAYGNDTGAPNAGAAYLFSVDGTLLTTFANPTPEFGDGFGFSVAAVGLNHVLVSAPFDNTGVSKAGEVYLFSTNGTLVTTFTNPAPTIYDGFGSSVAAVESDRVLIGAHGDDTGATDAGAAYLFSTNGTLLTTFTNPTPASGEGFGYSVAAMGNDRVLIGAVFDNTGAAKAGAVYLFSTDGTLLTTFTNPAPTTFDGFGNSVAAVGSDRVLIGADGEDTGAQDVGAAYLFSTNGTLLVTFTNPTPAGNDLFGHPVAAVGSDRVLIGAYGDDTGATDAGAAYLFSTESFSPSLVADAVNARSVTTASLEDGAVTAAKLDPGIGVWSRSGDNMFRLTGNVGIGTSTPGSPLEVRTSGLLSSSFKGTALGPSGLVHIENINAASSWNLGVEPGSGWSTGPAGSLYIDQNAVGPRLAITPSGNVGIGTTTPSAKLEVAGEAKATIFTPTSDRNAKENFVPISPQQVLARVIEIPIAEWNFKEFPAARHIGPVAQDFHAAFSLNGADDKHIATVDADGVALAAIQGLNQKLADELKRRDQEIAQLKRDIEDLKRSVRQFSQSR